MLISKKSENSSLKWALLLKAPPVVNIYPKIIILFRMFSHLIYFPITFYSIELYEPKKKL